MPLVANQALNYVYSMLISNIKNFIFFTLLSTILSHQLLGQEIKFRHISVEDGLSSNKINCLLTDHNGFVWFGTEDGLNRYDGYEIKIYRHQSGEKNSISSNGICSLFEDKDGFIWIGTRDGEIDRYDQQIEKFESWKLDSLNKNENRVFGFYQDRQGKLWIGTYRSGLYQFDTKTEKILHWQYDPNDTNSLSNNFVTAVLQDTKGNYWISTYNGLNKLTLSDHKYTFTHFYSDLPTKFSNSSNLIWNMIPVESELNKFWICSINGLEIFNADNFSFEYLKIPLEKKSQFDYSVGSVIEENTPKGKLYWIGTYNGLLMYDPINKNVNRFLNDENNPLSLTSNQINGLLKDNSGVMWIATENGVNYVSPKELRFTQYFSNTKTTKSFNELRKTNITSICKEESGAIWIGTDKGLFSISNVDAEKDLDVKSKFLNVNVWSLCDDGLNNIWIGTYGQGLKKLNLKNKSISDFPIKTEIKLPSLYLYVKTILKDRAGEMWIGYWGSGLVKYDPQSNTSKSWINDPNDSYSLSYNDIWSLCEDHKGNIWIGTNGGGLNLFDKKKQIFFRLTSSAENRNRLNSNSIYSICESKKLKVDGNTIVLWLGTSNGLNKLIINNTEIVNSKNEINAQIKVYTMNEGLSDNSVKSITEDNEGTLWLGTANGLSQFDPKTEKFINYSISDGLNGNNFNFGSSFLTKNNWFILGGVKGLNIFKPQEISSLQYKPPIYITDFQLFNKSVGIGEDSPINKNISFVNEINLDYDENIFSFRFSALDYNSPQSIRYAYKLEGFDKDWIISGKRNYAAYTNLSPGTYNFRVKSTNSDGLWVDNIRSVKVIINSPWWKTSWAFGMYLVIIFLGLIGIRRFELDRAKLRNELKMREFETHKLREVENIKSRFFANLSHEFRTPLMLIKGPIEQLRSGTFKSDTKNFYNIIYRNAEKLNTLIDQLLELTQLEAQSIPLKARKENLVVQLKGIFYSFKTIAEQKNIVIEFETMQETICAWIDRDKLEKIINNILSNAFKFTPDGGMITLSVKTNKISDNDYAIIKISDTGIGIPKEKLSRIFDRFYQVDDSSGRAYGGSGIGLSLVKELVDLHRWKIDIESDESKGTSFIISIPLSDDYLSDHQKVVDESIKTHQKENIGENEIFYEEALITETSEKNTNHSNSEVESTKNAVKDSSTLPIVLIVEDSDDIREYIKSLLSGEYKLVEAENGESGLKVAADTNPDIIISDIMMPGMDGIEFCKKIKTDLSTSHIPVILLTAKASEESKIEGLETGADDYITKPFSSKELTVRIKNLLEQRKKLKEKFSKEIIFQPEKVTANSLDKQFLEKAIKIAEKNLFNLDFDLEIFAKEMFLSRSQLHRKMIAITGQAPGEFLRIFKLKKAANLILERKLSVTQIALEVGFSSPSHFTKAFQQYFNCLPSEFIEKNHFYISKK